MAMAKQKMGDKKGQATGCQFHNCGFLSTEARASTRARKRGVDDDDGTCQKGGNRRVSRTSKVCTFSRQEKKIFKPSNPPETIFVATGRPWTVDGKAMRAA